MSRLQEILVQNSDAGSNSLGMFVTSGFPEKEASLDILRAIASGGADFIELGMPFSDPLAEGSPIQRSSRIALQNGVTMRDTFQTARSFTNESDTPLVLMGYTNPVMQFGISNFFNTAHSSGVDAVILPDLTPEEAAPYRSAAAKSNVDLVFLIAPTSPDKRIEHIDALSTGFVYAVSITGLTGGSLGDTGGIGAYLQRAKKLVTKNPLLVGFGISSHADVLEFGQFTDGCIVGSALIKKIESTWQDESLSIADRMESIRSFVRELKHGPG